MASRLANLHTMSVPAAPNCIVFIFMGELPSFSREDAINIAKPFCIRVVGPLRPTVCKARWIQAYQTQRRRRVQTVQASIVRS